MQVTEAREMIKNVSFDNTKPMVWADLGCGDGIFTYALAELLAPKSIIYAIDRTIKQSNKKTINDVEIKFMQADFVTDEMQLPQPDGFLMANSLHYVKDKIALLTKLKQYLSKTGFFIIIEYDTLHANKWVPFPINMEQLKQLFSSIGYTDFKKIGERPSLYGSQMMYCCVIRIQP